MNETLRDELETIKENMNEEKYIELDQLLAHFKGNLRGKSNPDVQLSASALVFEGDQLFFIEHPYQKEWLLPAGHVELGECPIEAAMREFHEETGFFAQKNGKLVDVNLISIPYNQVKNEKAHTHIDFRYVLKRTNQKAQQAELPVVLLREAQAPEEFKKYYSLIEEGKKWL
ncbi:NUDIX domain-containing protein [Lactococcus hircilactis]|uniref:NUDIX domain-containing protein n=1 Tax=Lactococcus hircilactis TaxID=1494462 RepID=A0A7X1Z6F9_9LACT|nr:NUDIX domain-containing protein [Lactococcus hircilactis]MQW38465.1 NUDIX domain-containing protein [Lactococcus hircilactis]